MGSGGSTVVDPFTVDPEIEGSYPAAARHLEVMLQKITLIFAND
jgi:hypothetical protein